MRISIIEAYWYYPEVGCEFPAQLAKKGHEVTAILWNDVASNATKQVFSNGFTVYKLPGINLFTAINLSNYPYVFGLPQTIAGLKPEIVDCQSHLFITTAQAVKAAKELGVPSVITVHGVMAVRDFATNMAQYAYLYTVGSWIFRKANVVRCLTESDAAEVIRYGCPPEKVRIIPNAVDTNLFKPKNKRTKNLVTWVGRFVHEKGLQYLIEAAGLVARQHKDVEFMLIGDGPLRREIETIVKRNGLSMNITFTGNRSHRQVAKTLQETALFVLPSLKEGMPLILLEAMACGVPVVCSRIPGISDVVTHGHNGLLVPDRNPEALANAILTLLDDESCGRRLGENARRLVAEKYGWDIIIKKIERVYDETIKEAH